MFLLPKSAFGLFEVDPFHDNPFKSSNNENQNVFMALASCTLDEVNDELTL